MRRRRRRPGASLLSIERDVEVWRQSGKKVLGPEPYCQKKAVHVPCMQAAPPPTPHFDFCTLSCGAVLALSVTCSQLPGWLCPVPAFNGNESDDHPGERPRHLLFSAIMAGVSGNTGWTQLRQQARSLESQVWCFFSSFPCPPRLVVRDGTSGGLTCHQSETHLHSYSQLSTASNIPAKPTDQERETETKLHDVFEKVLPPLPTKPSQPRHSPLPLTTFPDIPPLEPLESLYPDPYVSRSLAG